MRIPTFAGAKRLHLAPFALATGVAAAVLLSASVNGTLSGFVASITNTTNTAATGTLTMQELNFDGSTTCSSTATSVSANAANCTTINKFGGGTKMFPGNTVTTAISIKNTGTVDAASFKLAPAAACTQAANGAVNGNAIDLCAKINIVIKSGAATVFSGTAASLGTALPAAFTMPTAPVAGASVPFSFEVTLDSSADSSYQGLLASVPLTWTFSS